MIHVVPLSEATLGAWSKLFEASAVTCFCRYWHFEGTKNDWLARCAFTPEANRDEHTSEVRSESPAARGLLAMDGDRAIGWMKLAPRAKLPKLRKLPVYRALDLGSDDGVYSIGCFLIDPERRGQGVARALVEAADTHVRAWGGRAIEAYPRRSAEPMHAEEAWLGPESIFVRAGFTVVHGEGPYPVLRKLLTS
jgi:GNAT superfamily N-acetyltransferase